MPLNPIVWNPNHQDPHPKKPTTTLEMVSRYHTHDLSPHQCGSCLVQVIEAPLHVVWSMVRRFDCPQGYKGFVKSCSMREGDGGVGSVREVHVVSGLPAGTSIERLDKMDDEAHVTGFSIVGGDHRLENYHSTTTVHREEEGGRTVVVESYVVDVPLGSTKEETCLFSDTIIKCNLRSLARITEKMEMKN